MMDKTFVQELVSLGAKAPSTFNAPGDCDTLVAIPSNQTIHSLAQFMPPKFIKQAPKFQEAGSFVDYVNRFKTSASLIFAKINEDGDGVTFTAVLDYHAVQVDGNAKAARCAHTAIFEAINTPEWCVFDCNNGDSKGQVDFAEFLEENAKMFVKPTGAELLELVKNLHGHKNARFESSVRLETGAYSCTYDEDIVVQGSKASRGGNITLPPVIEVGLAVFQGGDSYKVQARLKTRIDERKLWLFYQTIARPQLLRESIMALVKQIHKGTSILPMLGSHT